MHSSDELSTGESWVRRLGSNSAANVCRRQDYFRRGPRHTLPSDIQMQYHVFSDVFVYLFMRRLIQFTFCNFLPHPPYWFYSFDLCSPISSPGCIHVWQRIFLRVHWTMTHWRGPPVNAFIYLSVTQNGGDVWGCPSRGIVVQRLVFLSQAEPSSSRESYYYHSQTGPEKTQVSRTFLTNDIMLTDHRGKNKDVHELINT